MMRKLLFVAVIISFGCTWAKPIETPKPNGFLAKAASSSTISYPTPICAESPDIFPVITGTFGGQFAATPNGLVIDPGSGIISPNVSTPGTYTVHYATFTPEFTDIAEFVVTIVPMPEPIISSNTGSNTVCVQWDTMEIMNAFVLSSGLTNPNYTYEWYKDGVYLAGQSNPEIVITAMNTNQSVYSLIMNSPLGCNSTSYFEIVRSGPASLVGSGSVITNLSGVQSITVTCTGYGIYQYSMDGGALQDSPVFDNVPLGTHAIVITDANSCGSTSLSVEIVESAVAAPLGSTNQDFGTGATLADITVAGTNVQWYASATNNGTGTSTQFPLTTSLPLNTPLIDGTTYYATQIVNGVESVARLAVTVHVTLGVGTHESFSLAYSPNPVINSLSLKAENTIDTITVTNLLGQVLKITAYNQSEVIEDMGGYTTGTYFVKVVSENKIKVIKILKN
jgi:hypothetical protein